MFRPECASSRLITFNAGMMKCQVGGKITETEQLRSELRDISQSAMQPSCGQLNPDFHSYVVMFFNSGTCLVHCLSSQ